MQDALSTGSSRELAVLAAALASLLARDKDQEQLGRLAAFFTLLGDTLVLFALQTEDDQPAK